MIVKITSELKSTLLLAKSPFGRISPHIRSYIQFNREKNINCLIIIKKEPSVFLSTSGTIFASLVFDNYAGIDWKELDSFFLNNDVQFVNARLQAQKKETNEWLMDQGYSQYESSIIMTRKNLDNDYIEELSLLKFHSVHNEATFDIYFDLVVRCLEESPDERAIRILNLQKRGDKVFKYSRLKTWAITHKPFVYTEDGEIQGSTELNLPKQSISNIGVLPENRRRGVGSRLLKLTVLEAQKAKFNGLKLRLSDKNTIALKMYRNHGFFETERLHHYWKKVKKNE